jgi:hypothetical protein
MYAHERIKVETTYKGKLIKQVDIDKDSAISTSLPSSNEVSIAYQTVLKLAETNNKHYSISVSENGIITTEL